ncbi:MAG: Ribonuclease D [Planctomycetes bacterium]|nr:Ribonuclease D [Planctomycetota bacterium]
MPEKTEIITDAGRLSRVIDELLDAPRVALDIESDGFYNYQDRVCIVTLSSEQLNVVVDTIALGEGARDMQRLLDRPEVPVLMHSGQNDVLALKRDYRFNFGLVHDTAVAAMLLGLQQTGLAALAEAYLGLKLEKELQRYDWSRRPIENEHLHYLINDTRHLFALHDLIIDELRKHELMDEYIIECDAVAQSEPRKREFDPERFRKIKGHGELSDAQRGVLKELYAWRNGVAEKLDRAAFRVTGDSTLLDIARRLPRDLAALEQTRGLGDWLLRDNAAELLRIVEEAQRRPVSIKPPKRKPTGPLPLRMDPAQRDRLGRLKRWREKEAARRGIGLQAVLPTAVINDLILQPPADKAQLAEVPRVGKSRAERYGDEILKIVRKPEQ